MSFLKFVKSLRGALANHHGSRRFVLGNSSADFDSIIGSLLYAFFMTNSVNVVHLPLIDCSEADMVLRFETSLVLQKIGVRASDLLYTEMLPELYHPNNTFYLYDHNHRSELPAGRLAEIIDHHALKEEVTCPNMITTCASGLTLIFYLFHPHLLQPGFEHFSQQFQQFFQQSQKKALPQEKLDPLCDELILYGILLDSYDFDPNQKDRWIDMDRRAVEKIFSSLTDRDQCLTYEQLSLAKTDPHRNLALSLEQQQRKDFKRLEYECKGLVFAVHYSTILLDIRLFLEKYLGDLQLRYGPEATSNEVHSFMFAFTDPLDPTHRLQKYKLFYSANPALVEVLENALAHQGDFQKVENLKGWQLWTDPTGRISRKSFDQYLRSFLKQLQVTAD